MGSCFSSGTPSNAADTPPTAKVITIAGTLREYSTPVLAADVLGGGRASSFLCSSDGLYRDDYIPALEPEELLEPGQIYFVLPTAKLRLPLSGVDMAALAVKASLALGLLSERGGRRKRLRIMPAPDMEDEWAGSGGVVVQRKMKRSGSARARVADRYYRYSRSRLSTVPELVE